MNNEAEIRIRVKIPRPPNFLISECGISVPVQDLSIAELEDIISRWGSNLITHAAKRRKEAKLNVQGDE